jgi:hypothetical protein
MEVNTLDAAVVTGTTPREHPLYHAVFCYNNEDREVAKEIHDFLKRCGLNPWIDLDSVPGGRDWTDSIKNAINHSKAAVIIFGEKGVSDRQRREAKEIMDQSSKRNLLVIPLTGQSVKSAILPQAQNGPGSAATGWLTGMCRKVLYGSGL